MAKNKKEQPKLKFRTALFKGSFIHNPVLTQVIGICPIVAAATTTKNGIALAVMTLLLLVAAEMLTSLFLKKIPRWVRIAVYTLSSALVTALFEPFITSISSNLGIYLYLLSVNALIVIRCEKFACRTTVRNSLVDAVACSVGFGAVSIIVGAVREFITYGTVFPEADALPKITASALPFVGLLILGILAALHKAYIIRFHPTEERDTFSLSSVEEKILLKDPGLGHKKKKSRKKASDDSFDLIRPRYSIEDVVTKKTEREDSDA
ncbi:MAG: hypothetical protein IJ491_05935 [Clostridia bacterium]|nr:hypothetical protein [Clostridia bacterium]